MSSCTSETFMMCCFGADTKVVVIDTAGAPVAAAVQLWPESNNDFFAKDVDAQVTFVRDASGAVSGLVLHQYGRDRPAKKRR